MRPKNPKPAPLRDKVILREVRGVPETLLEDLIDCAGYRGPARALEEMEAGIAPAARLNKRKRSQLPVARAATGRTLPALSNAEIQLILDEEEAGSG